MEIITTNSRTIEELYVEAFRKVYRTTEKKGDVKLYKEVPALLQLDSYEKEKKVGLDKRGFWSTYEYLKYETEGTRNIEIEIDHYNKLFNFGRSIDRLLSTLSSEEDSKKHLLSF